MRGDRFRTFWMGTENRRFPLATMMASPARAAVRPPASNAAHHRDSWGR